MKRLALCVVAFGWLYAAEPASAQGTGSGRPYQGLFEGKGESGGGQRLDFTATLMQAYDDNLLAERSVGAGRAVLGGHFTMLAGDASYNWSGQRVQFGFTGESAVRYFSNPGTLTTVGHSAGLGIGAQLARRLRLTLNQTASYSPSYLHELFPTATAEPLLGAAPPIGAEYIANDFDSYSYTTRAALTHTVNPRTSLGLTGDHRRTDFTGESTTRRDLASSGVRAQLSRNTSRNTSLRAGYRYRTTEFALTGTSPSVEHGIDIGVDYSRPLSATRNATFAFRLGSSAIDVPAGAAFGGRPAGQYYRVTGDAVVRYQVNRTWLANARYRRGFEYVAEFPEPVFSDAFSVSAGGGLTRRLFFSSSAAYSRGQSAAFRQTRSFDTYTGNLRLQYAMTPRLAASAEYVYYYYDFRSYGAVLPGLPEFLQRNSVRVGLTLWVPVVGR